MPNRNMLPERRVFLALVLIVSVCAICLMAALAGCSYFAPGAARPDVPDYAVAHGKMMLRIEEAGVKDPLVLQAVRAVPRHKFVPKELRDVAYLPRAVPPDPVVFAKMAELLGLKGGEKVLQVGTGSGYQAAVLSRIAGQVYSVEIMPYLASGAAQRLERLGYSNVTVRCADPAAGWEEHAPFDAIMVTHPVTKIPQALVSQLKEDGRMAVAIGGMRTAENGLWTVSKKDGGVSLHKVPEPPAPHPFTVDEEGWKSRTDGERK
jgi:protein-L-isoaspartate(D-aspartate) O-methyltransferase